MLPVAKHKKLSLQKDARFSETWLHDCICAEPTILGLGDVEVLARERPQFSGGRLDLLLWDADNNTRFEVEIMLGATDPNHIIRCIEYWDIERRRYPAYDHIAVIVAEEITTRFLNVMAILAGSVPLIAVQLNALEVGSHVVLDFVKVLDQRMLREDDTTTTEGENVDRSWWEKEKGVEQIRVCDRLLQFVRQVDDRPYEMLYKRSRITIGLHGSFFKVMICWPKIGYVRALVLNVPNRDEWTTKLEVAGVDVTSHKEDQMILKLRSACVEQHQSLLGELLRYCLKAEEEHS